MLKRQHVSLGFIIVFMAGISAITACLHNPEPEYVPVLGASTTVREVRLTKFASNPDLNREYIGMIRNDTIEIMVDYGLDITSLEPTLYSSADSIKPVGPQNFTKPIQYTLWANGEAKNYTVMIYASTVEKRQIKRIYGSYGHLLALMNDGTVWACGGNEGGQLALGDYSSRSELTQVPIYNVDSIHAAGLTSVFYLKNGTAWGVGNSRGELGLGHNLASISLVRTPFFDDAVQVDIALNSNSFVLKADGTLWGSGSNYDSLLATGDILSRTRFLKIPISNVKQISAGLSEILILKNNGELWGWGNNRNANLGTGDSTFYSKPVQINLPDGVGKIVKIRNNTLASFIQDDAGKIWGTGYNLYGQLGIGTFSEKRILNFIPIPFFNDKNIVQIVPGARFSMFIDISGTIWAAGSNSYGYLAQGKNYSKLEPTPIIVPSFRTEQLTGPGSTVWALKRGDRTHIWAWGHNEPSGSIGVNSTSRSFATPTKMNKTY